MGKITDNASKTFKKRRHVHVPSFFVWAQYVALAIIPVIYFSYFIFNKPGSYVPAKRTIQIYESYDANDVSSKINNSVNAVEEDNSTKFVTVKDINGESTKIEKQVYDTSLTVAKAFFNGNWSKIQVLGTVPSATKLYPKVSVKGLLVYTCDASACVIGAKIDRNGDGSTDESIQFTLTKQAGIWYYQGN